MFLILFQKHPQLLAQRAGKIVRKPVQPFSLPLLSHNLIRRKCLTFRRSRPPAAAAELKALVRGNVMYLAFIGTLGFLVTISTAALAETLIEKSSQFGADFTSTELVAIFMAEVAYCEAKAPEFKKQAAMPLAKLRATKKFQDISNSPNFAKLSIEASELVSKRHADSGAGSCMNKLESVRHELQRFQQ